MKNLVDSKRTGLVFGAILLPVILLVILVVLNHAVAAESDYILSAEPAFDQEPLAIKAGQGVGSFASPDAFVFRFDPKIESFETFTVPTSGAKPNSIAVISNSTNVDVWFTEPGADRIGRMVYTGTQDYVPSEYAVAAGSEPLNLAEDGAFVWFTARQGNFIGRVDIATGQINTFGGLTPASHPAGIDIAPNGSVWFAETAADQIGRLAVTSTIDYELTEYPINGTDVGAYGVEVQSDQYVWFSETKTGRVRRLKAADGSTNIYFSLGQDSFPFEIVHDKSRDYLWVTEFQANRISQLEVTTNNIANRFDVPPPPGSPRGLTQVGDNEFWFSQYTSGQIGRLEYTSPLEYSFRVFDLPVEGLFAADIAASGDGALWVVAYRPNTVHLPVVVRNFHSDPPPPFGVQMYGASADSTGLSKVAAAGVRWIREPFSWASVEPNNVAPDQYQWGALDAQVAAIVGAGIEPLLTLGGNPKWAAEYPTGPVYNLADLQEFVGALVERYDGDGIDDAPGAPVVRFWEIYNEPDGTDESRADKGGYGFFGYHGAEYAATLDAIYPVVKAANPKVQVVFGGVASDNFVDEGGAADPGFVDEVLSNCVGPCFDVMNFHYFPLYRFRWNEYGRDVIGKAEYFRSKLRSYGFDRPIMCTETTWGGAGVWGSEALQNRYVIAVNARAMAADLKLASWYAWKDVDSGLPGLLTRELQPKPAYNAYRTLTEQLDGAVFQRTLSTAETGDVDIEAYSFSVPGRDGWERRDVVWLDCPSLRLTPFPLDCPGELQKMSFAANAVRVTNMLGASAPVTDSDDGLTDGLVTLKITPNPIFVDFTP